MAKSALALALAWAGCSVRVEVNEDAFDEVNAEGGTELAEKSTNEYMADITGESSNQCRDFQYTRRYAECSYFTENSRYTEAYCNAPISKGQIVYRLKKDKCIECDEEVVAETCEKVSHPCDVEAMNAVEDKDVMCKALIYEKTSKGNDVTIEEMSNFIRERNVACSLLRLKQYCETTWHPQTKTCTQLDTSEKNSLCERMLTRSGSAREAAQLVGAVFGARCEIAEVREICGKQTCEAFTDQEFEQFCESKKEAGMSAKRASSVAAEFEKFTCSEEQINAKCGKLCDMSAEDEKDLCDAVTFGYTRKGRPYDATLEFSLKKMGIRCDAKHVKMQCEELERPACNAVDETGKTTMCSVLAQAAAKDVVGLVGGILGVKCTNKEIREMCGKTKCAEFDDYDWENLCRAKESAGVTRVEFAEGLDKEGLQCSADELKTRCPNQCGEIDRSVCGYLLAGTDKRGNKLTWTDALLRRYNIHCSVGSAKESCLDGVDKKCEELDADAKGRVCSMRERGQSDDTISAMIKGGLAIDCSAEQVAAMCAY